MNRERYVRTVAYFKNNQRANLLLTIIYKILPNIVFASYIALLIYCWLYKRSNILEITLFPLGVLIFTTIIRVLINEKRPYEVYGVESVFNKQTKGKSMPSRHAASTFIIAMAFMSINLPLGIFMLFLSLLIGASRVLSGAHFIRDVVIGMVISVDIGWIMLIN